MRWLALLLLLLPALAGAQSTSGWSTSSHYIATPEVDTNYGTYFFAWSRITSTATDDYVIAQANDTVGAIYNGIYYDNGEFKASCRAGAAIRQSDGTTATLNVWQAVSGLHSSSTFRRSILDAVFDGQNTQSCAPASSLEHTAIGVNVDGGTEFAPHSGQIAFAGMWQSQSVAMQHEFASGMWPEWINTADNLAHWFLMTHNGNEVDMSQNGHTMVEQGTGLATNAEGPPVFFPIGGM